METGQNNIKDKTKLHCHKQLSSPILFKFSLLEFQWSKRQMNFLLISWHELPENILLISWHELPKNSKGLGRSYLIQLCSVQVKTNSLTPLPCLGLIKGRTYSLQVCVSWWDLLKFIIPSCWHAIPERNIFPIMCTHRIRQYLTSGGLNIFLNKVFMFSLPFLLNSQVTMIIAALPKWGLDWSC